METTMNQAEILCRKVTGHEACHQPWGKYLGRESITRCLGGEGSRKGILDVHCAVTECLEVAGDGETARGCWMFQSITTDQKGEARWIWYKADICFVPENGAWKLWMVTIYPMFNAEFTEDWGKLTPTDWDKLAAEKKPDAPMEKKPWHLGDPIRLWECYPPKPYAQWNETVLGRKSK